MNFGGNEVVYSYSESRIIIVPVPYDGTSTWMKGADKGPDAILEHLSILNSMMWRLPLKLILPEINTIAPVLEKESPNQLVKAVYDTLLSLLSEKKFL